MKGFTITEAMISMLILTVVSLGAFAIFPSVTNQQRDEDSKSSARKVLVDLNTALRRQNYMQIQVQMNSNPTVWVWCFDSSGNQIPNEGSTVIEPKGIEYSSTTQDQPITSTGVKCPNIPRLIEVHAWEDPNSNADLLQRIQFVALVKLGNNTIHRISAGTGHVHN